MRVVILIVILIVLSSCSSGRKKATDKLYYRFAEPEVVVKESIFSIPRPTALGILGNRPMVAQNSDGALLQLNHNFWLDSPKVLLQNYLIKSLNASPGDNDNQLKASILNLEKIGASSVVSIAFTLVDVSNTIIFQKTYKVKQEIAQNTMPAFVQSVSASLELIVQQLAVDLK